MATRLRLSALIVGTRYEIIYVAMLKPCDIVREMHLPSKQTVTDTDSRLSVLPVPNNKKTLSA